MAELKTPRVEIIADQCKGCELCVLECPKKVLYMSDKINRMGYTAAAYKGDGCIECGACVSACPVEALSL